MPRGPDDARRQASLIMKPPECRAWISSASARVAEVAARIGIQDRLASRLHAGVGSRGQLRQCFGHAVERPFSSPRIARPCSPPEATVYAIAALRRARPRSPRASRPRRSPSPDGPRAADRGAAASARAPPAGRASGSPPCPAPPAASPRACRARRRRPRPDSGSACSSSSMPPRQRLPLTKPTETLNSSCSRRAVRDQPAEMRLARPPRRSGREELAGVGADHLGGEVEVAGDDHPLDALALSQSMARLSSASTSPL